VVPRRAGPRRRQPRATRPAAWRRLVRRFPGIRLPVKSGDTVEGLVDVNGHDIYARCSGTGSPTVIYFTGWAPGPSKLGVNAIRAIEAVDGGKHRICSYERRNTGRSEKVQGTQTPEDVITDVDGVLDALGEHGPFILLGVSFGGLVAGAGHLCEPRAGGDRCCAWPVRRAAGDGLRADAGLRLRERY
jgi:hypothetical protein